MVKAQSEIIENLSNQVSSISKETGNEKFQQVFDEIAKHSGLIHDVTKQLDETIMKVNKLVGEAVEIKSQFSENLTELEGKIKKNEESIKMMEGGFTLKIEKLEQIVKTLSLALQYTGERHSAARTGNGSLRGMGKLIQTSTCFGVVSCKGDSEHELMTLCGNI